LPADGVYAVLAVVNGRPHPAVANLGGRPTFDEQERQIEIHVLDFDGDLYQQQLTVEFVKRLRGVRRFNSVDELREQIARDIETARQAPELQAATAAPGGTS
jgi:riboflavin kinase/FMN adenylyltransferase